MWALAINALGLSLITCMPTILFGMTSQAAMFAHNCVAAMFA